RAAKSSDSQICRLIAISPSWKEKGSGSNRHDSPKGGCPHPPSGAGLGAMHFNCYLYHGGSASCSGPTESVRRSVTEASKRALATFFSNGFNRRTRTAARKHTQPTRCV